MRESITQEMPYGCGIASFAFVCNLTYKEVEAFLGKEQADSERFLVKHLSEELNRFDQNSTYAKPRSLQPHLSGMRKQTSQRNRYL